ncbi:HNH endonuclease [Streptomyces sp. 378]|uniref:HNH endonuclease n=1 Tax=Streptomyces sp. 378 TaxID=3049412 RepID=UPI0024C35D60|nr:HNH endonuclease [Streptomyces sp. 378]MDK1347991.1 HNH endonuclease [Streptomyces sp. 378]
MGSHLRVGEVLRSAQNRDPSTPVIDGYRNIHHVTASRTLAQIQLSKGINPVAKVRAPGGRRRPAILIRSSPWKAGTAETPWHDVFDLDNGRVRYFGDHRVDHPVPVGSTQGNAVLLEAFAEHQAPTAEQRALAVPLLLFAAVTRNKTPKGYVEFCGVAVIERVEQIEQETKGRPFPNYRYDLVVLDLSAEDDQVDWAWIEARGNPSLSASDALELAPRAWRQWVKHGHPALPDVRRQKVRSEGDPASRSHSAEDSYETAGLFPAPRQPDSAGTVSFGPTEQQEELTATALVDRLRNLKVHRLNGRPSRHKPLSLLWGISRIAAGKARLAPWREFRDEVGGLLAEFGLPESSVTPEYPFWRLKTSHLWQVTGFPSDSSVEPSIATLERFNAKGGLNEQAAHLLSDSFVRSQAVAVLRETYLADVDHSELMDRLGLAGYENASGVPDGGEEREMEPGPASRRTVTLSRIVRDPELTATVKRLHGDRCQVCGLQLSTRFTTYSEAAHIRGLGRPHNGPDKLSNLLVLCPNHHVQFDALAIYVDTEDTVRVTADGNPIGQLRRHPAHQINEAHLRYHRALCGRDDE